MPYFGFFSAFFNDCDGFGEARAVTKPIGYYLTYMVIEIVGALLYWFGQCFYSLKWGFKIPDFFCVTKTLQYSILF